MQKPLLSVVIPTCNRPLLLPRAIRSALLAAPDEDVEVIVIPNGPNKSWQEVAKTFKDNRRVHWHPISAFHANAARNHGLSLVRGELVRFLDDDDYLLPAAVEQTEKAYSRKLEICSAPVSMVSGDGSLLRILNLPLHDDFVTGVLSPERRTGLQFHLYKSNTISKYRFDETIAIGQDTHWTHFLCQERDWEWSTIASSACTWVQHSNDQLSSKLGLLGHIKLQENMLWNSITKLNQIGRLDSIRSSTAAKGMWRLIHNGFYLSPRYWNSVIKRTEEFFPDTYPDIPFYNYRYGRMVAPSFFELSATPKKWVRHIYRHALIKYGARNFWQ